MGGSGYAWEQAADGTYAIRGVPIFELGAHRGFPYDAAWARRALETFARLKADRGYLPPVILGHTAEGDAEKPAVGFLDRLRLAGTRIVADLVGLGRDLFGEIRAGRWPYRSVEVFDRDAQITALALLGGTPPYMKTAPLHFAEDGIAALWLDVPHLPRLDDHHDDGGKMDDDQREIRRFGQGEVDRLVAGAREEERVLFENERLRFADERQRFAEESRQAEEALRGTRERLRAAEESVARFAAEAHAAEAKGFRAEIRRHGYSPAIADAPEIAGLAGALVERAEPVRFGAEDVSPLALLGRVLALIADRAAAGTAFAETGEKATAGKFSPVAFGATGNVPGDGPIGGDGLAGRVDPASVRRYAQARELAKDEGIAFRDALTRVMQSSRDGKQED